MMHRVKSKTAEEWWEWYIYYIIWYYRQGLGLVGSGRAVRTGGIGGAADVGRLQNWAIAGWVAGRERESCRGGWTVLRCRCGEKSRKGERERCVRLE